jgi:DNA-binding response OmpR family regulator
MKILIIEDEIKLAESIAEYLQKEGYVCESAHTYIQADDLISMYDYECLIIDLTLPGGSGLNLIQKLKKKRKTAGILIISAKNSVDDKIKGLEIGADDYLAKPFHLSELNARLKSIIRRIYFLGNKEIIINEIRILPDDYQVYVNNQLLALTKKEYDLLIYFISNQNRVVTKESIAEHLWGEDSDMADSYDFIYTHVKNLRKKIIEKDGNDYIKTIYKMGYKFEI